MRLGQGSYRLKGRFPLTIPLREIAASADRLTDDYTHVPVSLRGPADVKRALTAFNLMGERLQGHLQSQQQLLAALGHDLRTPIAALRLRIEMLTAPEERERMLRSINELQSLTEAALEAAAGELTEPDKSSVDAWSLVDSLCSDFQELDLPVEFSANQSSPIIRANPESLARALRNVIENALRYGKAARVQAMASEGICTILVDDDGPGIPGDQLERVFEPLARLEESRNPETGGHGLGLYIARGILRLHDGSLTLQNRPEGGLRAIIRMSCAEH